MDIRLVTGAVLVAAIAAAPALAAETAAGKKLYDAKCAMCHAKDGKGNPSMVKMFKLPDGALDLTSKTAAALTDADIAKRVQNGQGKMVAVKGLQAADIADIIRYLRSWAPKKAAAAKEAPKPDSKEAPKTGPKDAAAK